MHTATSHHYSMETLVSISRRRKDFRANDIGYPVDNPCQMVFRPQQTIVLNFQDIENVVAIHSFDIIPTWNKRSNLSCLSTCYEVDALTGEQFKTINHHYFDPDCPNAFVRRTFCHRLRPDEQIRVNARGVEMIVLGQHGRHAAWLVDREDGGILQIANFNRTEQNSDNQHGAVCTISLDNSIVCQVDSLELEDAHGVLYLTTTTHLFRYEFT